MSAAVVFRALDGSNPLAFMAAVGAFRLLQLHMPDTHLRLEWKRDRVWRPCLTGIELPDRDIATALMNAPGTPLEDLRLLGKNLTVDAKTFATFVRSAVQRSDRRSADFAAAFGCEALEQQGKGRIEYTQFCFITGSGHQDFIGTIEALRKNVTAGHLHDALFGEWREDKGLSMRWDPSDAAQYALRWKDPSKEGASAVWGANWLAFEALPVWPALPTESGLKTTGFRQKKRRDPEFTWPIWTQPASLDTVRSLLALSTLQAEFVEDQALKAIGIDEVYRSQRVRIGQGANFKVSFLPARSV